jgi:formyl-CoA transferase
MRAGVAIVDLFTGLYTCTSILAALYAREKTGEGATIDMALFDTQIAVMANQASNALISGKDPPRQGNTHPNIVPYQPFDAADQPIIIAVGNDRQFARLAEICGHPEWASDERFASNGARVAHREEMVRLIGAAIARKPAAEWLDQLEEAGIPAGPINRLSQALSDVQAQHRQMVRTIGGTPLVGSPVRLDGERADSELPPPRLGEHTQTVVASLGLDQAEIARLKAEGVLGG